MYYGWVNGFMQAERETARNASAAEGAARRAENAMERVEDQLQRQALIIRALLEMCAVKGLFHDKEFRQLVNDIDMSDGRLDGKFKPQQGPQQCPECGKVNGKHAVSCMYCNAALPDRALM